MLRLNQRLWAEYNVHCSPLGFTHEKFSLNIFLEFRFVSRKTHTKNKKFRMINLAYRLDFVVKKFREIQPRKSEILCGNCM